MQALYGTSAGQPCGGRSFVQRLDVRTKMGISLMASLAVLLLSRPEALGLLAAASALYALSLRRIKVLMVVYAAVLAMWCAAVGMMALMHNIWPDMPALDLGRLLGPFLRTMVMVNVAMALALSSRIQGVLTAMKSLHLPFCIYMPLVVMIRFLPNFIEDIRQISECLRTRGHGVTPAAILSRPVLTTRLLVAPLLFRSLRAADELGVAGELKGLGGGQGMTSLKRSRFGREDLVVALAAFAVLVAGTALQMTLKGPSGGIHG